MIDRTSAEYVKRFTKRNLAEISATLESLSAQRAYNSLETDERIEYGVFSKRLDPLFFYLDENELNVIEKTIPEYWKIVGYVYRKKIGLEDEKVKLLMQKISKKSFFTKEGRKIRKRRRELLSKIIPKDYEKIQEEYEKELWYDFRKILALLYAPGVITTYLTTQNPYALLPWIAGIAPYYTLKMLSYKIPNKRISSKLRKAATAYFYVRYGPAALESIVEFGFVAPTLGEGVERAWKYTPKPIRKILFRTGEILGGVKRKKFDEKEIRQELYSLPEVVSNSVPPKVIERFKEKVENEEIEIEDTGETLFSLSMLGYYRRPIVVKNGKIVDKKYVRKLAAKEGTFLDDFENKIVKRPWEYLGMDINYSDDKAEIVWVKDVIGVTPSRRNGLYKGILRKEGYLALLGTKSDEIFKEYVDEIESKLIIPPKISSNSQFLKLF